MDNESRVYQLNSFFMNVCMQQKFDLAIRLLESENDVNVNWRDMTDETSLMRASQEGLIEVVSFLLEKGADVNAKQHCYNCQGVTALMKASNQGHAEIVKILLENGADVDCKSAIGNTALMKAREKEHVTIMALIKNHIYRMICLVIKKGRTKNEIPLVRYSHKDIAYHVLSYAVG